MAIYFSENLESKDLSLEKRFAFGQDYGDQWFSLATRPAWEMIKNTDLESVAEHASSQSALQKFGCGLRRARAAVIKTRKGLKRGLKRRLRRLARN